MYSLFCAKRSLLPNEEDYLLLFYIIFLLRAEEDDITFDASRVIYFSPKVKNIVKEED